jgi:hypothetical protein
MPSETGTSVAGMDIASVRILRLALGTSLSLWFSQIAGWPMSFVAAVVTMFVLALPVPVLKIKAGIGLIVVLTVCAYAGLALLPFILNQRLVGIGLLALALFYSFYFTAKGGSPVIGAFATIGLAIATSIGTVSIDAVLAVVNGLVLGVIVGTVFVWIAHALLPDSLARPPDQPLPARPAAATADLATARRSAWRSLLIVMPVILWFLLSSASASYAAVLIKVSAMGQQAGLDQTKQAGKSLLVSTVIGGIAAIIGWQVLSIWPSLTMYVLFIGLAGLAMGPNIFKGPGLHEQGATWSYGFLTMIVILAPAVSDSVAGSSAGIAFWSRMWMFVFATLYAVVAVFAFDVLWPARKREAVQSTSA